MAIGKMVDLRGHLQTILKQNSLEMLPKVVEG